MHLVQVIQLEIEVARIRRHQLLRKQSHSPECILSKTLSSFKNRHEVVEIFNKMCWQKCIWFQSSNLKSKSREHVATNFWWDSRICLNVCFPRHFQASRTDMRSLRYSTKCVGKNASGSSHLTWNRYRENTSPPTSDETVAFAWMYTFQDTFKLQEQTWGRWDIQQNVSAKMHLVPVIQLENRNRETTSHENSEAAVAFAWVRRLQNTPKFHKPPWGCQDIQQSVLAIMDLANQAGAFGFLRGGFAVASWLLHFNTLHSFLAIASPVCLSQFSHHCSLLLSSDEDDTCLQCIKFVVVSWYWALLNVMNCAIFKKYKWVLSLLVFVILPCT
jgi:hypothetical protein